MSLGTAAGLDGNDDFRSGRQLGDLIALTVNTAEVIGGTNGTAGSVLRGTTGVGTAPAAVTGMVSVAVATRGVLSGARALIHLAKSVRGPQDQVTAHEQKLVDYKNNPDAKDNKEFLKDKTPEQRQKIIEARIGRLEGQIANFKKQVQDILAKITE